jgi:cytochrome c oxidase cbb3-type subunit IV
MSIMTIRLAVTVISFLAFLGIVAWAYARKSKSGFDAAANSIFKE